jgi:hypothetical protein
VAFALGIITGVVVGVIVQVSTTLWLAAHQGRVAARVLAAELAGHELALCRWLDLDGTRDFAASDPRYELTFAQVAERSGRPVPALPSSAWSDLRAPIVETAPNDLVTPLVGWYEPLADRELLKNSRVGRAVVGGFVGAREALDRLEERSRWRRLWYLLRRPG